MLRPLARPAARLLGIAIVVCATGAVTPPVLAGETAKDAFVAGAATQRSGPTGRLLVTTRTPSGLRSNWLSGTPTAFSHWASWIRGEEK